MFNKTFRKELVKHFTRLMTDDRYGSETYSTGFAGCLLKMLEMGFGILLMIFVLN